jgi:hypothetical protein
MKEARPIYSPTDLIRVSVSCGQLFAGTSCLVKARRAQLPGVALPGLSLGLPGFSSVTARSPAWVFSWSGSSKLSPCSPIGWKWCRGWLQGLGRRSLRIVVDWKELQAQRAEARGGIEASSSGR